MPCPGQPSVGFCPTDPGSGDTDGDGIGDLDELSAAQLERLAAHAQLFPGCVLDTALSDALGTDPNRKDADGDGLDDFFEVYVGWTVRRADGTFEQVLPDARRADGDGDGLSDQAEFARLTDPQDPQPRLHRGARLPEVRRRHDLPGQRGRRRRGLRQRGLRGRQVHGGLWQRLDRGPRGLRRRQHLVVRLVQRHLHQGEDRHRRLLRRRRLQGALRLRERVVRERSLRRRLRRRHRGGRRGLRRRQPARLRHLRRDVHGRQRRADHRLPARHGLFCRRRPRQRQLRGRRLRPAPAVVIRTRRS
jgi:hypothetical protein